MIKTFAKWILNFILLTIAVTFSMLIIKTWEGSEHIAHIWGESSDDIKVVFIAMMIFAGLYFINILARLIIWKA